MRFLFVLMVFCFGVDGPAAAQEEPAPEQGTAWRVFRDDATPRRLCFASARALRSIPNEFNLPSYAYFMARPEKGVQVEFNAKVGYRIKPGTKGALEVDHHLIPLSAEEDRAFIADAMNEKYFVEAMRTTSRMVVRTINEFDQMTTDFYSVEGLAQAFERVAANCP